MFSSDVSARGLDYPDVTKVHHIHAPSNFPNNKVIQVGVCSNREQYIHRIGRTARAGKEGMGISVLCDFEKPWISKRVRNF